MAEPLAHVHPEAGYPEAGHPEPTPRSPHRASAAPEAVPRLRRPGERLRHRRPRRLFALLRLAASALLLVATPVGLAAWLLTGPQFALAELEVEGTPRVPAAWVEETLAPLLGRNLIRLSLAEVQDLLEKHPWVADATLDKRLPAGLGVAIAERRPAALLATGSGTFFVDSEGDVIAPCAAGAEPALLRLVGSPEQPRSLRQALAVATEVAAAPVPWAAALEEVEVLGEDSFRLRADGVPFPLLVARGSLEAKAGSLNRLFPEIVARYEEVEAVDLRFARRIVVRPQIRG